VLGMRQTDPDADCNWPRMGAPVSWIGRLVVHTGAFVVHRDTGCRIRPTGHGSNRVLDQKARTRSQ